MREIKFRAWHKQEEVMGQVEVLTIGRGAFVVGTKPDLSAQPIEINNMFLIPDPPTYGRFCPLEDIDLMQYTGLKDKNGKEIYEGDILKHGGYLGRVEWYNKIACFQQNMINSIGSHNMHDDVEVIGNIYENPELLS